MNNPVFNREDFRLCEVPVPVGYPQSQTHVGVCVADGNVYLTTSPYPGPLYGKWQGRIRYFLRAITFGKLCKAPKNGEIYENPCIYKEKEKNGHIPCEFALMQKKALMETPCEFYGLSSYNSDPDIFIENRVIHIINRSVIRTKISQTGDSYDFNTRIYLIKGIDENGCFKLLSNQLLREGCDNYVSPSLTKYGGKYLVVYLDNKIVGKEVHFKNMYISISEDMEKAIVAKDSKTITVNSGNLIPWHMSLFQYKDTLFSIITCVETGDVSLKMWQMIGKFDKNLESLYIYPTPLTDYNSYRGSAFVKEDGTFVLYTPTVHEKLKGASSIDGRDVLVASMNYDDLLTIISK